MQTSINLQEPFTYSIIPLVFLVIIIMILIYFLLKNRKIVTVEKEIVKEIPEKNIKNIPVIKNKYLKQLDKINNEFKENLITLREAYQSISEVIRLFVFEVTDITTQNYTLTEIKKLDLPVIYELIEEYYEPEFASKSIGDFDASINKTRRIINEWN